MHRYTLTAVLLLIVVASSIVVPIALAQSAPVAIRIELRRYGDSLLLSAHLSYTNKSAVTSSSMSAVKGEISIFTRYVKNYLYTHFHFALGMIPSEAPPGGPGPIIKMLFTVYSEKPNASTTTFKLVGNVTMTALSENQANGTALTKIEGWTKIFGNATKLSVRGFVAIELSLIPPDQREQFVRNLEMLSAMLNPMFVNAMLEKYNVTWVKVEDIRVDVSKGAKFVNISFSVLAVANMSEYLEWLKSAYAKSVLLPGMPKPVTMNVESLASFYKALQQINVTSKTVAVARIEIVPGKAITMLVESDTHAKGDIEKLFRVYSSYLIDALTPPSLSNVKKYLSQLVVLPYNTSVSIAFASSEEIGQAMTISVNGLRIGHRYLKGDEGFEKVLEIVSSAISGLKMAAKKLGVKIPIVVKTYGLELKPSPQIATDFAKAFEKALSKAVATWVTVAPPPPTVSVTTTSVTVTVPYTISAKPTAVTSVVYVFTAKTATVISTVTKLVTTTITSVSTAMKTVTSVVTSYVTKTVTTTVPTTVTSVSTTTVTRTEYGLAIGLLILGLAVGFGISLAVRRRS